MPLCPRDAIAPARRPLIPRDHDDHAWARSPQLEWIKTALVMRQIAQLSPKQTAFIRFFRQDHRQDHRAPCAEAAIWCEMDGYKNNKR
ncbi:hypothetical protein B30_09353 [Celeribacter baekdonensis B30]|uniref:Uncharacterized protein n=1 Tax=Celeribacter baekdonensis B30 TaxID=1208323 RepID=K2K3A2_9RHOB|nr:hypothetical protein B30_09353 [Celeribacter baekdonensis B30]